MQTIFTIIAVVLSAIVALVVALKAWRGTKKGAYIQPIYFGLVLVSAILAFIGTSITCGLIFGIFEGQTMEDLITTAQQTFGINFDEATRNMLLSFDPAVISYILAIPVAIIAPIAFLVYYIVIKVIANIIFRVVRTVVKIPKRVDTVGKTVGGTLGAIEGLLVMVIWLVPLVSLLHMGTTVVAKLDTEDATANEIIDVVEDFTETPVLALIDLAGGNFLSTELTTVKVENTNINVTQELAYVIDLFMDVTKIMENSGDDSSPTAMINSENEKVLDSILATLDKSEYMPLLLSGAMRAVSGVFFADLPETPTEPLDKLFVALSDLLNTSEKETVVSDLRTMKELLFMLEEYDVLETLTSDDPEAITNVLSKKDEDGNTIIKAAIETLKSNSRTVSIIGVLNEISVSILCDSMGLEGDAAEVYDSLKTGLNDLIAIDKTDYELDSEYKASIKNTLNTTLEANDIVLEDEIVSEMANQVATYLDENRDTLPETITDAEVTEILLTYYDAYVEYMKNQDSEGEAE